MKINEAWLRDWVSLNDSAEDIAERLTLAGLEVDGIERAGPSLANVCVARIVATKPHPDAERLRVCTVEDGSGQHQVVCGAPNAAPELLSAFARPGAMLPNGMSVEVTTIRGVESAGMLCSAAELGLGDDADGIMELQADAAIGDSIEQSLQLNDPVFDIGLTPNRGDCFSALGIARDLGVLTRQPIAEPDVPPVAATIETTVSIELDKPEACARYAGRVIEGIDPGAKTPLWMSERLRRAGVRVIHPVVDITNYVMLDLGQPMHAFDLERLNGGIIVRSARADESLLLLDGQEVSLDSDTLVIADHDDAVALAGVMGGENSSVSDNTTSIFLESAYFDAIKLAGVARRFRLHTDASMRFERGVDPTQQARAIERATSLILEICGGKPGPTTVAEATEHVPTRPAVEFRPQAVNALLGTDIDPNTMLDVLRALAMEVNNNGERWSVTPPAFRFDIEIEADLIEEVARIVGYDNIPTQLPQAEQLPSLINPAAERERRGRNKLVDRGYSEAITYSFIAPELATTFRVDGAVTELANPISSEMTVMRPSLWPGLVQAVRHNRNRQHEDVRLFEFGMVFNDLAGEFAQIPALGGVRAGTMHLANWSESGRETDFFDLKQDVVEFLEIWGKGQCEIGPAQVPALHPGQSAEIRQGDALVGYLGRLHPAIQAQMDLSIPLYLFEIFPDQLNEPGPSQFTPFSKFPAVRRDLNVVVDDSVLAQDCIEAAKTAAGSILRDLQLFDVYRGQGIDSDKKSLTLGLIFQDVSSTLTEDEVDAAINRVLDALRQHVGGTLRE